MSLNPSIGRRTPSRGVKIEPGQPTILFLTVCATRPANWLASQTVHNSLASLWRSADTWLVGDYLLMPDHIHLFCSPRDLRFTVDRWVAYWKSQFSRQYTNSEWIWQRTSFHHRLRTPEEYREKLAYVRANPVRKALVPAPELWPFAGKINTLHW